MTKLSHCHKNAKCSQVLTYLHRHCKDGATVDLCCLISGLSCQLLGCMWHYCLLYLRVCTMHPANQVPSYSTTEINNCQHMHTSTVPSLFIARALFLPINFRCTVIVSVSKTHQHSVQWYWSFIILAICFNQNQLYSFNRISSGRWFLINFKAQ